MKIGELLIEKGLLTVEQLNFALEVQQQTGSNLGKILAARGHIKHYDLDRALAQQMKLPFVEIMETTIDQSLIDQNNISQYLQLEYIPLSSQKIAVCNPTPSKVIDLKNKYGSNCDIVVSPKEQIMFHLHFLFRGKLSYDSVYALAESYPDYSAGNVFITNQLILLYVVLTIFFIFICFNPMLTFYVFNVFVTFFLVVSFIFKFTLTWFGSAQDNDAKVTQEDINLLDEHKLPMYTILVPMFNEPEVLPIIVNSLRNLNYPKEKLDIKLVLEEVDQKTIDKALSMNLEDIFDIIIVPDSQPRTKPKACNYALYFAKGEYLTIYDAEDKPEPNQLKSALCVFDQSSAQTAVVQARLNYYNDDENLLTKNFTLEYSLWFDFFLPALDKLDVPIPLGGTSNHFKTNILKAIGGWDPFNVTEDADLGIRYSQLRYKVAVVNSTTYEEANTATGNWIRQRSRWIKGYMQTYLVHMRSPLKLLKTIGIKGFLSFQFFIGMSILTALITPFLYSIFIIWFFSATNFFDFLFDPLLLYLSHLNLLLGNSFFIYIMMLGTLQRRKLSLVPYALTVPFYWILLSIAAYKALIQLFTNPFYWEKTQHGLSKVTQQEVKNLG